MPLRIMSLHVHHSILGLAVLLVGCPGPALVDGGLDTPALDTPAMDTPAADTPVADTPRRDVPFVDGRDSPADPPDDVFVIIDAGPPSCGWSEVDGTFVCGGSDPMPVEVRCTGTNCCLEACAPGGTPTVCCDPVTGIIQTYNYSAGACPLDNTETCS